MRHQSWNIIKTKMSPKLSCHQKLNCHQNWNVTKTEILPYIIFVLKNKKHQNSRDWHWIPWSCLFKFINHDELFISKAPVTICDTSCIDQGATCTTFSALLCTLLHYTALTCTVLHYIALHCTALQITPNTQIYIWLALFCNLPWSQPFQGLVAMRITLKSAVIKKKRKPLQANFCHFS